MSYGPPLRVVLFASLVVASSAFAAPGLDGLSIPSSGGGFAAAAEPGALGVIYNPAAVAHGEAPELLVDVGLVGLTYTSQVGVDAAPETLSLAAPHPSLAVSVPIGRFGVGGFVHAPYVRAADGSGVFFVESTVVGAFRATDWLTVAAGLRVGGAQFGLISEVDTGEFLNENVGLTGKLELPVGDPFLQGEQRVPQRIGIGVSPTTAVSVRLPGDIALHAMFRPRWVVPIRGPLSLRPSNDLTALVEGDVLVRMPFPLRAALAASIPIGRVTLMPELELVDWARSSDVRFELDNLRITASDPVWDGVLQSAGLAEAEFLEAAEVPQLYSLGWRTVVLPSLQANIRVTDTVDVRAGFLWGRTAVPDEVLDPFNVDFETFTIRAGGAWRLHERLRLAGSAEWFASPARIADTAALPRSLYQASVWRLGLTAQVFFPRSGP